MSQLVKLYAQSFIGQHKIADMETQKWIIYFADQIDNMLDESAIKEKENEEKN